jgi:hypothetical protein
MKRCGAAAAYRTGDEPRGRVWQRWTLTAALCVDLVDLIDAPDQRRTTDTRKLSHRNESAVICLQTA